MRALAANGRSPPTLLPKLITFDPMSTLKTEEPKTHRDEQGPLIDTSKMSAGQRAALEMTESAREIASERGSFGSQLFMGRLDLDRLFPFPMQSAEDRDQGDAFLKKL